MRLPIYVHGRFHARTEPWRYEDSPAQHRAERDVKVFVEYVPLPSQSARRTEKFSPPEAQKHIQCFFWRPRSPPMGGSSYNWLMLSPTFSPWDRREYPAGGRGWIKLSAHSCRNEVCDHSSASVVIRKGINLCALCGLCVKTKHSYLYLTQRTQRTQNFQCKLRYRWSSRRLRATETAKANWGRRR